jgi:tetratricopeptide (TPR) repeat protein
VSPVDLRPPEFRSRVDRGVAELRVGHLDSALEHFSSALEWATANGDERLVDLACCNRAAILIELGDGPAQLASMRAILLRSGDTTNSMVAATNVARIYDLAKDYKKALFYARLASNHAELAGDASQRATVRNLVANLLLVINEVDRAVEEYETALQLMPDEDPIWRARVRGNLGYCRVLQGRSRDAFSLLHECMAELRRRGATRYFVSPLLDLAFAHLETGHHSEARSSATEALALARQFADEDSVKNALYLVGQAASLEGDLEEARRCFGELQQSYYPTMPFVAEFLLAVDVRKMVNLRA